ncbi:hypothetical protein Q7P37_009771 [Cladosporium fusiforme]
MAEDTDSSGGVVNDYDESLARWMKVDNMSKMFRYHKDFLRGKESCSTTNWSAIYDDTQDKRSKALREWCVALADKGIVVTDGHVGNMVHSNKGPAYRGKAFLEMVIPFRQGSTHANAICLTSALSQCEDYMVTMKSDTPKELRDSVESITSILPETNFDNQNDTAVPIIQTKCQEKASWVTCKHHSILPSDKNYVKNLFDGWVKARKVFITISAKEWGTDTDQKLPQLVLNIASHYELKPDWEEKGQRKEKSGARSMKRKLEDADTHTEKRIKVKKYIPLK